MTTPITETDLRFDDFREANVRRCEASYRMLDDWSALDWAIATFGEAGEAMNVVAKIRRDGDNLSRLAANRNDLLDELADTVIYADLLLARVRFTMREALLHGDARLGNDAPENPGRWSFEHVRAYRRERWRGRSETDIPGLMRTAAPVARWAGQTVLYAIELQDRGAYTNDPDAETCEATDDAQVIRHTLARGVGVLIDSVDALAYLVGAGLDIAVRETFNTKSEEIGSEVML